MFGFTKVLLAFSGVSFLFVVFVCNSIGVLVLVGDVVAFGFDFGLVYLL